MSENNGKYKLAFWVMVFVTTVLVVGAYAYTTLVTKALAEAIVVNDRIHTAERQRIENKIEVKQVETLARIEKNAERYFSIDTRLARIEQKLGIAK